MKVSAPPKAIRIGVDVGGTFTDLVVVDEDSGEYRVFKEPTTPSAPEVGIARALTNGISTEELARCALFVHGTTVGLNALLERKGPRIGILTTRGFRDSLELRRSKREEMYNLSWQPPEPLIPRYLRLPITERILSTGQVRAPLDEGDVVQALEFFQAEAVESVVVCFLNSYANGIHESLAGSILRASGFTGDIVLSHRVSREFREYERTSTSVIDAFVRPRMTGYLSALANTLRDLGIGGELFVTRSGGGAMTFDQAGGKPFETIISGPVGGVEGAAAYARRAGLARVITADVGGTSFDTALISDGKAPVLFEGEVEGLPVQSPWVDVRTIGAGGGSIAYVDEGGLLKVGPRSAGAEPGPACYGRGGQDATVTDAACVLGMLGAGLLAGGRMTLDTASARHALARVGELLGYDADRVAQGTIDIATANMADAIREITVERGEDPRDATLLAFGGAGPLFATLLARALGIQRIVVPPESGNYSAWGLLGADVVETASRTWIETLNADALEKLGPPVEDLFSNLIAGRDQHDAADPTFSRELGLDIRYAGQEHTLTIPIAYEHDSVVDDVPSISAKFIERYASTFGVHSEDELELSAVRVLVRRRIPPTADIRPPDASDARRTDPGSVDAFSFVEQRVLPFRLIGRASIGLGEIVVGPAIITERTSTTYVDSGFTAEMGSGAELLITASSASKGAARASARARSVDPVSVEIIRHGLSSAAEQMKRAIIRTAFSPIIYETWDFAAAIYDSQIRMLAQAQTLPLFLGTFNSCISAAVNAAGGVEMLRQGDVILYNIPYGTGSHSQDVVVVQPVFADPTQLVGYTVVKAHWRDIGGKEPFATDTVDVFQEGMLFPGVRLFRSGERVDDLYQIVLANTRVPRAAAGDLDAAVIGLLAGKNGLLRVIEKHGLETFNAATDLIFAHSEAAARAFLEKVPDGRYVAHGMLDDNGIDDAALPFEVVVEVEGSNVQVDYRNAPDTQPGPVNCPLGSAISASQVAFAMLSGGGEEPTDGYFRPLEVLARRGSLFHAEHPAPCNLYGTAAMQAIEVIFRAIGERFPDAVPAGSGGDLCGFITYGQHDGNRELWEYGAPFPVGQGAEASADGTSALYQYCQAGGRSVPVEVMEASAPWLFEKLELAPDSGGTGKFRGGLGVDVFIEMLEDVWLTSEMDRTRTAPWGLAQGNEGRPNSLVLRDPSGRTTTLGKITRKFLSKGSVCEMRTGGGGGHGPPSARDKERLAADARNGYVTGPVSARGNAFHERTRDPSSAPA